jgi:hypothetical protein
MSSKTVAVILAVAVGVLSLSAVAQEFSIKGTWIGHRERLADKEGYRNGKARLIVTEQQGMTFKAEMHWSTASGEENDRLVGAFTPGGHLIMAANAEGTYVFSLVDGNTLDFCFSEHGNGFRTTCGRLTRQP